MKISPNSAVAFAFVTCAMIVTSCAKDVETDINIDPTGNAISFTPSVGHSTRATETTISNLGNFAVVARGMHHDGVLYDNFLIGDKNAGEIAKRSNLQEGDNPTSGTWKLDRNVYWPSSLEKVLFFAYTTLKYNPTDTSTDVLGTNTDNTKPSFGFEGDNPYIKPYKPLKADLATTGDDGIWADGKGQKDLLVAFTQQTRSSNPTNVDITFEHALTQVSITAKQKDKTNDDHRIVKIKGAWIVNATEGGNLTTTYAQSDKEASISKTWTTEGSKTAYGAFYTDIITLDNKNDKDLLREHSLMLVPEDLTAWESSTNDDNGAYILLLCRVELMHNGTSHTGSDIGDIAIEGTNHYHQLFPVNEEEYDGAEYGFVCVPLTSDWNTNGIGKHYTYNLDICGNKTGAGKYPPTMTEDDVKKLVPEGTQVSVTGSSELKDLIVVTTPPSGKQAGDNVLDEPIKFTVKVEGWQAPQDWTPGNGSF